MAEIVDKLSDLDWLEEVVSGYEVEYEYAVEETSRSGVVRLVSVFPEWGTLEDKRELVESFRDYAQNEAKHWGGEARLTYKIVRRPKPLPYEVVEGE